MALTDSYRNIRLMGSPMDSLIRQVLSENDDIENVLLVGGGNGRGIARSLYEIGVSRFQPCFGDMQLFNVYIMEHSLKLFNSMKNAFPLLPFVDIILGYPVASEDVKDSSAVRSYYQNNPSRTKGFLVNQALRYAADESAIASSIQDEAIQYMLEQNSLDKFDMIICDGPFFSGDKMYSHCQLSKYVVLFDINTIKSAELFDAMVSGATHTRVSVFGSPTRDNEYNDGFGIAVFKKNK